MKNKSALSIVLLMVSLVSFGQSIDWNKIESDIQAKQQLFKTQYEPAKVLLLGTFHFNYPNLDAHKIDSSKMMNVMSEQRQKEIRQIVDLLKKFKPTRIYIEMPESYQGWVDSLYKEHLAGRYKLGRNEIYQLGFRTAAELGHQKLYAVDDQNFVRDNYKNYGWIDSLWINQKPVDSLKDKRWNRFYQSVYSMEDSLNLQRTLLETLLMTADPRSRRISHGHYMAANLNTEDNRGPDALALWWYSRNLRIFNNVLQTRPTSNDRILLIFGSGHIPILHHLFEGSPEFEVVPLKALVK